MRFLNSEPPKYPKTHKEAQEKLFEILGELLSEDLDPDTKREYQKYRIQVARNLGWNKDVDMLVGEYAGFAVIGKELPFKPSEDPFEAMLFLADRLHALQLETKE